MGRTAAHSAILRPLQLTTALVAPLIACSMANQNLPPSHPHADDIVLPPAPPPLEPFFPAPAGPTPAFYPFPPPGPFVDIGPEKTREEENALRFMGERNQPTVAEITGHNYRVAVTDPAAWAEREEAMNRYQVLPDHLQDTKTPWVKPESGHTDHYYWLQYFENASFFTNARHILHLIEDYADVTFTERSDGVPVKPFTSGKKKDGKLKFLGIGDPDAVLLEKSYIATDDFGIASDRYQSMQHEFLHMLGAAHFYAVPLPRGIYSDAPDSVMHYGTPGLATPGIMDITYLQAIFGPNWEHNSEDTVYRPGMLQPYRQVIWDAGGNDTLDLSYSGLAYGVLDLREGVNHWSNFSYAAGGITITYPGYLQFAYGSNIENGIATVGEVHGNILDNVLQVTAGSLRGYKGDDVLVAKPSMAAQVVMEGGEGRDSFAVQENRAPHSHTHVRIEDYTPAEDSIALSGGEGPQGAFLVNRPMKGMPWVVRFHFADDKADRTLDLDILMDGSQDIRQARQATLELEGTVSRSLVYLAELPKAASAKDWRAYIESRRDAASKEGISR